VERKTIVRRAALIGVGILVAATFTTAMAGRRVREAAGAERQARQDWMARVATEDQALLDGMAQKITGLPVDPKVVAEIQAEHYRQRPGRWLYVWGTANDGRFLFGVPADAFARLNTVYDQSQQAITEDNHFATRDQFLRALLHEDRPIAPIKPGLPDAGPRRRPDADEWWRRYDEQRDRRFDGNVLYLSSPIQGAQGAIEGSLNLKAIELGRGPTDAERSLNSWRDVEGFSGALAVISLLWLWFLVPSWVYIDAQDRRLPKPLLWALLVLVGNLVGLLVYLISRPDGSADLRCPHCAKKLNGGKAGCPYCGADLSTVFCAKCQYPLKPDWSFCPDCRAPIAAAGAAAEPAPPARDAAG
jgi:hypothetical protein